MDKVKFWKKDDDMGDLGDFSDLGDFGMESSSPSPEREQVQPSSESMQLGDDLGMPGPADPSPSSNMNSIAAPPMQTSPANPNNLNSFTNTPVQPTTQAQVPQQVPPAQTGQQAPSVQALPTQAPSSYQQSYSQGYDTSDIEKDMQIILARLDAIRSSLDNVNRRLDNLERITDNKQRHQW